MWLVLPAEVKTCRFTIGFRGLTLQERGMILLTKSRLPRRFPTVANWIIKHLPTTERWVRCRHDVQLIASANRLETNVEMAAPINRTA
jgi:hypothetical protein